MKTPFSLLVASSALTLSLGLPAFAAVFAESHAKGLCAAGTCTLTLGDADQNMPLIRVSGDDDDDHDEGKGWSRRKHREHDDDDDECEGEGDDDDDCGGGRGNPARAGTVAPPNNGLFGNGAAPKAVTK